MKLTLLSIQIAPFTPALSRPMIAGFLLFISSLVSAGDLHVYPDGSVYITKEQAEALEANLSMVEQEMKDLRQQLKDALTRANAVRHCS